MAVETFHVDQGLNGFAMIILLVEKVIEGCKGYRGGKGRKGGAADRNHLLTVTNITAIPKGFTEIEL